MTTDLVKVALMLPEGKPLVQVFPPFQHDGQWFGCVSIEWGEHKVKICASAEADLLKLAYELFKKQIARRLQQWGAKVQYGVASEVQIGDRLPMPSLSPPAGPVPALPPHAALADRMAKISSVRCPQCQGFAWHAGAQEPVCSPGQYEWHHPACPSLRAPQVAPQSQIGAVEAKRLAAVTRDSKLFRSLQAAAPYIPHVGSATQAAIDAEKRKAIAEQAICQYREALNRVEDPSTLALLVVNLGHWQTELQNACGILQAAVGASQLEQTRRRVLQQAAVGHAQSLAAIGALAERATKGDADARGELAAIRDLVRLGLQTASSESADAKARAAYLLRLLYPAA
jgi:hypothetical protein